MPSIIQCTMGTTALTFSNEATTNSDGDKVTTDSCNVAKWYEQVGRLEHCSQISKHANRAKYPTLVINKTFTQVTWSSCTQSDQPSSSGTYYHMEVTFSKSYPDSLSSQGVMHKLHNHFLGS